MSKAHDMGGRLDPRRIDITSSNVKFKADWEKEVFAITLALGFSSLWNLDSSRYSRQSLEAKDYLQFGYFEKWLAGLINLLGENGIIKDGKESGGNFKKSSGINKENSTPKQENKKAQKSIKSKTKTQKEN